MLNDKIHHAKVIFHQYYEHHQKIFWGGARLPRFLCMPRAKYIDVCDRLMLTNLSFLVHMYSIKME